MSVSWVDSKLLLPAPRIILINWLLSKIERRVHGVVRGLAVEADEG